MIKYDYSAVKGGFKKFLNHLKEILQQFSIHRDDFRSLNFQSTLRQNLEEIRENGGHTKQW